MPFFKLPVDWGASDHGIVYDNAEFHERLVKPMQHLEAELQGTDLMKTVVNQIKFIELDRIINGCVN